MSTDGYDFFGSGKTIGSSNRYADTQEQLCNLCCRPIWKLRQDLFLKNHVTSLKDARLVHLHLVLEKLLCMPAHAEHIFHKVEFLLGPCGPPWSLPGLSRSIKNLGFSKDLQTSKVTILGFWIFQVNIFQFI